MDNLIGKVLDNYKIVSVLGKGGMGIVYKAYDTKLDRYVAIKMLNPSILDKGRFIERFKREAKNQAQLSHPNIVTVYGFIEYENLLGIVMEYVHGESLENIIERKKRMHLFDAIYILRQILLGIGYAHSKGFIHRDIKPSNIILNGEGVAKIMDFGISKSLFEVSHTKTGSKVGTLYYMSPEQIKGKEITHHSDIYSIGCTFYEMITGYPPFYSNNEYDIMENHLKKNPVPISSKLRGIPDVLDRIISLSLNKNPNARYNSCEDFLHELLELDKFLASQNARSYRKKKKNGKHAKFYSILVFSGVIVFMIALSYFVYNQVFELLNSKQLDNLKKYNIESLFENDNSYLKYSKIQLVESGVKHNINSIHFIDAGFGIALGDSGTIITTRDSGNTWIKYDSITNYNLHDAYFLNNGSSYVVGSGSKFYFSENYLSNWRQLRLSNEYTLFNVDFVSTISGFVLGTDGFILRTSDGGTNWTRVQSNTQNLLYDIKFLNENTGFIVGWRGTILKTVDKGLTWKVVEPFTNKYLKSIDFWDDENGLIVGGGGSIFCTSDGGENWTELRLSESIGLQKVKYLSKNYAIILGGRGHILISDDGGTSWGSVDSKVYAQLNELTISPAGIIYIVGSNGTILKLF
ncbi:protein kinase [Bacteroidota bacterium]